MNTHRERIMEKRANTVKGFVASPRTSPKWSMISFKENVKRGNRVGVNSSPDRERGGVCGKCDRMFATGSGRKNHMANYHAA